MKLIDIIFILSSAASFIAYGWACVFSDSLSAEFQRYNLAAFRKSIGLLEIAGGLGLLIGLQHTYLLFLSSLSLATLMLCAVIVRIKIKDSLLQTLPALALMLINFIIAYRAT